MIYEIKYTGKIPPEITNPARAVQLKAGFEVWRLGYDSVIARDDRKSIATQIPISDEHLYVLESRDFILREMQTVY